jgi:hypothetical protein
MVPNPNHNCAQYKISAILPIWPIPDKEFLKDKGKGIKDKLLERIRAKG